jgi:hypothetical protein
MPTVTMVSKWVPYRITSSFEDFRDMPIVNEKCPIFPITYRCIVFCHLQDVGCVNVKDDLANTSFKEDI